MSETKEIELQDIKVEDGENLSSESDEEISHYDWTPNEFYMLRSTYERLSINSARLLETAKTCKTRESTFQYLIVLLGLSSSFISALPGINETVRAYITSAFTLTSAIIGGFMSKKRYGQKAGKYYSAYQEYKDLLTAIDNIMVSLKSDRSYESFNYFISKIESKYEIFLPVDIINVEKIKSECDYKFSTVKSRFERLEQEKINQKYKNFIDRKSYIYLHECKLKMYRTYVYKIKVEKKNEKIMGCYEYEDWCRINHPEKYKTFTKVYDDYVKSQISRYYDYGEYNAQKIDLELSTKKVMSVNEKEFIRIIYDKFIEYQNAIKDSQYEKGEEEDKQNYSLDI